MKQVIIVDGDPKGKGRPRFAQGHAYTPQITREYERTIRDEWMRQAHEQFPDDANIKLTLDAIFSIPKSAKRMDKLAMMSGIIRPTKKPDADNILKIAADALNGYAYSDDKQIIEMSVTKRYGMKGKLVITLSDVND